MLIMAVVGKSETELQSGGSPPGSQHWSQGLSLEGALERVTAPLAEKNVPEKNRPPPPPAPSPSTGLLQRDSH